MSPQRLVLSTTYKTRVALENPCNERLGSIIGQLTVKGQVRFLRGFSRLIDGQQVHAMVYDLQARPWNRGCLTPVCSKVSL
jgi:hypothetical protein